MPRFGAGPAPANIMIVGDVFSPSDEQRGEPFLGSAGEELNKLLHEAGIMRTECYCTNVVNARPPHSNAMAWVAEKKKDRTYEHKEYNGLWVLPPILSGIERLQREIALVQPSVIITLGNLPLWALTGAWGALKWRGSQLTAQGLPSPIKLIPTLHPSLVLAAREHRASVVLDLKRAAAERLSREYSNVPDWAFLVRPSFASVMDTLRALRASLDNPAFRWIDFDLETRAGHIACAGFSWTNTHAICIPFMDVEHREGYWSVEEEAAIVHAIYLLMTDPRVKVRGQNLLYDCQYTYRHWHFVPRVVQDTMISQHTAFVALQKSLAFQASMYCNHYIYWKDDGKTWSQKVGEDQLWRYNCIDCVRTREVGESHLKNIPALGLQAVEDFQQSLFWPVLKAMQRGVRINPKVRNQMAMEVQEAISEREAFLLDVIGHPLNPKSPLQMSKFFYEDLQLPKQMTRAKKGIPGHLTCDDEALSTLSVKEPLVRPIIKAIQDIRTLGVFLSTFISAPLDTDGRMRCSYNIGGNAGGKSAPYSYRLSSDKNAFGTGANLQNIPSEKSKSLGKAQKRGMTFQLPNIRRIYIPDPGYTFFDMDLDRADLQVVVWESNDEMLKAALRQGVDIHLLNVYALDGQDPPPLEELVEGHERYPDHRGPRKHKREFAKVFCHASNYGGGARTVAANTGRSVHEIDRVQRIWFGAHPGIKQWHEHILEQVNTKRYVENKFGYRWHIFDRLDGILPEALAWIPQSTVGCYINRIWKAIYDQIPEVEVLLQVHDSLAGQFPTHKKTYCLEKIQKVSQIVIPYDDPLIIPVGIATSEVSWGDVE